MLLVYFLPYKSFAGYETRYKWNGGSNRYKVSVDIWLDKGKTGETHPCFASDHGRTWAAASCYQTATQDKAGISVKRGMIGISTYTINYTNDSRYTNGAAFYQPSVITGDTSGVARSEFYEEELISSNGNITTITFNNFSGFLSAAVNTQFGSSYRIIVWRQNNLDDSILTPQKVLWQAGVRIENGLVIPLGDFQLSDFNIFTVIDSTGYQVLKVTPVSGLTKIINIDFPNSDSLITITTAGDAGFGVYNPNAIFQSFLPTNSIPTLSQWGIILLGFMLFLSAVFYILKIRNINIFKKEV